MAHSPTSSAIKFDRDFMESQTSPALLSNRLYCTLSLGVPIPTPPSFSRVMYCDGSFVSDSSLAAYGITIVNSHGQVYDDKVETFLCSHPIKAEALGLLNAILLAVHDGITTCIRADCQVLSLALNQDSMALSSYHCSDVSSSSICSLHPD
ncbi:unnamed protein product [Linum trigynum]|uniref:RNase H type-1 domain-containing protein n=1 Tax=Linum trigynum TaxID=586398 RepID=A0AAV2GH75_9ROSI